MPKPLTWAVLAVVAGLVLNGCQDATEPVALATSAGSGNDTECRGPFPGPGVFPPPLTGTFDNVVVPPGENCFLLNSVVRGNVKALEGARLVMINDMVRGNIEGDKANAVAVDQSTVGGNIHIIAGGDEFVLAALVLNTILTDGNIQIEKGRFPFGDWVVTRSDVQKGSIKVEENGTIFTSFVAANNVAQNVQVFKNTGPADKIVADNTIGENLQCKENDEPFVGQPNVVGGNAEDQCADPGTQSASFSARVGPAAKARPDFRELLLRKQTK